jgi:hypothetical protein
LLNNNIKFYINKAQSLILLLILIVCIFDPSNEIFGLKNILFSASVFILLFLVLVSNKIKIIPSLLFYLVLFSLLIPFLSFFIHFLTNDISNFLQEIKSYLFLFLVIVLINNNFNFEKWFIYLLTFMSAISLILFVLIILFWFHFTPCTPGGRCCFRPI